MFKLVLVVENDPMLRHATTMMFEDAGLHVEDFAGADEALLFTSANSARIAAVFTDVQMPGVIDGSTLAKTIAAQWPHIVVVVNSGQTDRPQDFPDSVRFILKPWRYDDVLPIMQDASDPL